MLSNNTCQACGLITRSPVTEYSVYRLVFQFADWLNVQNVSLQHGHFDSFSKMEYQAGLFDGQSRCVWLGFISVSNTLTHTTARQDTVWLKHIKHPKTECISPLSVTPTTHSSSANCEMYNVHNPCSPWWRRPGPRCWQGTQDKSRWK